MKTLSIIFILASLSSCTMTEICVHNENGSTCTVDTSTSANPQVDPNITIPTPKL